MTTNNNDRTALAASVASEDLKCGDFVAVLNEIFEIPSFFWTDAISSAQDELIRLRCCASDGGTPMKVKAICLPFVLVKPPRGPIQTLDVRQVQLVRLERQYARHAWRTLKKKKNEKQNM